MKAEITKSQITKGAIHSSIVFNNEKDWTTNYQKVCFGQSVELVIPEAYMLWNNEGDVLELTTTWKMKSNGHKGVMFQLILNGELIKEAVRFETIENFLYKTWSCEVYGINIPEDSNVYEAMTKALVKTHALNQKMGYTEEGTEKLMNEMNVISNEEEVVDNAVNRLMEGSMDSDEAREVENLKKEIEELKKENEELIEKGVKKLQKISELRTIWLQKDKENEELKADLSSYKTIHKIQCESLQKKVKELKEVKEQVKGEEMQNQHEDPNDYWYYRVITPGTFANQTYIKTLEGAKQWIKDWGTGRGEHIDYWKKQGALCKIESVRETVMVKFPESSNPFNY